MVKNIHKVLRKVDALNEEAWSIRRNEHHRAYALATQAMAMIQPLQKTAYGQSCIFGYASALCVFAYCSMREQEYATAREQAAKALLLFQEGNHASGCARVYFVLGSCDIHQGQPNLGIEQCTAGLAWLEKEPDPLLEIAILQNLGVAYLYLAHYAKGIEYMEQALTAARRIGDMDTIPEQTLNLGALYGQMGEGEKGLKYLLEFLVLSESVPVDRDTIAAAYTNIGLIFTWAGDYGSALEHLRRSLAVRQELGDAVPLAEIYSRIGVTYSSMQEYALALPPLLQSLAVYEEKGLYRGLATCLSCLASAELGLENIEAGLRYAQRSVEVSRKTGDGYAEYHALLNIGRAYSYWEQWQEALAAYSEALAVVEELGEIRGQAGVYTAFVTLYTTIDELEKAREYGKKAEVLLRDIEEKPVARDVYKALSTLYERMGKTKKELEYYKALYTVERAIHTEQSSRQTCLLKVLHEVEEAQKTAESYRTKSGELEQRVEQQNKELAARAMLLSKTEEFLHKIKKELQEACRAPKNKLESQVRGIIASISTSLADGHTWNAFEELFTKVHHNFIALLKEQYPALSSTELKVCALVKIDLSSKEISRLLHVSVPTVETYRHRIRKKVGLEVQETLQSFLTRVN